MKVNILGAEYTVNLNVPRKDNEYLEELDGYTDDSSKTIVVCNCNKTTYDNPQDYKDRVLLHEIVHSFLNECGLPQATCDWHCEEMVEWCAFNIPKIMKVYECVVKPNRTVEIQYIDDENRIIELDD